MIHSIPVEDIIPSLSTNPKNWHKKRKVKNTKLIVVHHDAQMRPDEYNPLERYTQQANYHIRKDWGGGYHGYGIMYHYKIDGKGKIYQCREFDDICWHARNANNISVGINLDGNLEKQKPTINQLLSLKHLLDELCTKHPEFPASANDVWGHGELTQYGNRTACPGKNLIDYVREYRENGTITIQDHSILELGRLINSNSQMWNKIEKKAKKSKLDIEIQELLHKNNTYLRSL